MNCADSDRKRRDPLRIPGYQGLLAHAMIATAATGGEIDPESKLLIARQVIKAGIKSGYDPRYRHAMSNPWTPHKLADHCDAEHHRLAVYQAALTTADPGCSRAAGFLETLSDVLSISRAQRAAFHRARRR